MNHKPTPPEAKDAQRIPDTLRGNVNLSPQRARGVPYQLLANKIAADKLTEAMRAEMRRLLDGDARKEYGNGVTDNLLLWSNDALIENMSDWMDATGWGLLERKPARGDKVEAALVRAATRTTFAGPDGAFPFAVCEVEPPKPDEDTKANQNPQGPLVVEITDKTETVQATPAKRVFPIWWAVLGTPRNGTPPKGVEPGKTPYVLGLDALKALFQRHDWIPLSLVLSDEPEANWLSQPVALWLTERAKTEKERADRLAQAGELSKAPAVITKGRKFGRLYKVTAGMSWAFGGPGVELHRVVLDGHTYAPAPDLAIAQGRRIVPPGYALLPADHAKKPHQTLLPIDTQGGQDSPPLPVALADATQYAITPAGGKLGLVIMAAAWAGSGKVHKTTLRELTQTINPDARLVKTHFETVCRGLAQLDGLRLVMPDGMAYRVFDTPVPWRELKPEEYDADLYVGMTRTFEQTLAAIQSTPGNSYRGDFLFDLTGAMKLSTRRAGVLRQYIRSAAYWNSVWKPGTNGEPDPARLPKVPTDRWAIMTNYLPQTAVEYVQARGGDRRRLSDSIKETLADAEALEEAGLVKVDHLGRDYVRLLPPPEYMEAWHESRKGAHRMPGNTIDG